MKTKFLFTLTVYFLLASSSVTGQEISKRTLQKIQRLEAMGQSTAEIVQVLPGEKIIEKTEIDNKTTLFCTDKSGKRTKIYEGKSFGYLFSHSQTGERLCFQDEYEFIVKDINTLQEFRFQTVDPIYLSSFADISPDGNEIVFHKSERFPKGKRTLNDDKIVVINLVTKKEEVIAAGAAPKWSPNGNKIIFSRIDGTEDNWGPDYVWIINRDGTGLHKLNSSIHLGGSALIQWSSDGKFLMDNDRQGNLRIVDVVKDKSTVVPAARFGKVINYDRKEYMQVSWSPDGKTILADVGTYNQNDERIGRELFLISVDGSKIEKIEIPGLNNEYPVWLNGNELLYRNSQQGNIWNKAIVRSAE